MGYVQNKNVYDKWTWACNLWEKEPKGNKNNEMHCWRQILANMFRSMALSWFINVKIP